MTSANQPAPTRRPLTARATRITLAAIAAIAARPTRAADRQWVGVGNGSWNTSTNWFLGNIPGANDIADIVHNDALNRTIDYNYPGPAITLSSVLLSNTGTGNTTFNINANTLTATNVTLGTNGGAANFNATGGILTATNIAVLNNSGLFTINGGTVSTAAFSATPDWSRLKFISGTLNFTGGISSNTGNLAIGSSTATATVNQTAGTVFVGGFLQLSTFNGGIGKYNLSGGKFINASQENIGSGGTAIFTQSGGTHTAQGSFVIGISPGTDGTYNLQGGLLSLVVEDVGIFGGNGTLNQTGGTNVTNLLRVAGVGPGGFGTINLSAGSLTAASASIGGFGTTPGGLGIVNLSGGTLTNNGPLTIYNSSSGTSASGINITGGAFSSNSVVNDGKFNQTGGTSTLGPVSGTGSLSLGGGTALTSASVTSFSQNALTVANNGKLTVTPATPRVTNTVNALLLTGNGTLDLANHALLIDAAATPLATVRSYLASARGTNGLWTGPGLTSANATADPQHLSLAYASGTSGVNALNNPIAGKILVRPALIGDANLNGTADNADISQLVARGHYLDGTTTNTWVDGDFNADGQVTNSDISLLIASGNYLSGTTFSNGNITATHSTTPKSLTGTNAKTSPSSLASATLAPATLIGLTGDGIPDFQYDPQTGDVKFRRDGLNAANIVGEVHIRSAGGKLDPNQLPDPIIGSNGLDVTRPTEIDLFRLSVTGKFTEFADNYDLGPILQPNLTAANLLTDLTLTYTIKGVSPDNLPATLTGVPEPTTPVLLALPLLGMLRRHRKRTLSHLGPQGIPTI